MYWLRFSPAPPWQLEDRQPTAPTNLASVSGLSLTSLAEAAAQRAARAKQKQLNRNTQRGCHRRSDGCHAKGGTPSAWGLPPACSVGYWPSALRKTNTCDAKGSRQVAANYKLVACAPPALDHISPLGQQSWGACRRHAASAYYRFNGLRFSDLTRGSQCVQAFQRLRIGLA